MGGDLVEALAAAVVGLALLWLVAQPLLAPSAPEPESLDLPEPEETARGRALLALKEIEFDRATGKLSDADFAELHARYAARALEVLDAEGATAAAPAAADRRPAGEPCPACGGRTVRGAAFCGACGASLSAAIPSQTTP